MMKSLTKKAINTIYTSAIILGAVASPAAIFAQSYDELINDTQVTIDNLSAQQAALYSELAMGYEALDALRLEAENVLAEISEDDEKIEELSSQIEELELLISKREELLADQARAVQANGGTTNYLNLIASSESISDFVGRLDIVRKMVSSNKDLLTTQKEDKEAVVEKQTEVEKAKEEKVAKQVELEALKGSLEEQQANQELVYNQLTNDITLAANQRDALIAEKQAYEEQQAIIAAQQAAQAQAIAEAQAIAVAAQEAAEKAQAEAELQAQLAKEAQEKAAQAAEVIDVVEEDVQTQPNTTEEVVKTEEISAVEEVVESTVVTSNEAQAQAEQAAREAEAAQEAAREAARIAEEEAQAQLAAAEAAKAQAAAAQEAAAVATGNVTALLSNASQYLGTPYVWGGKNPSGFDCSGFVQYVFQQTYGVNIGGWTGAQENSGTRIGVSEAQAGDLYFWGEPGGTYHVAIATGNGGYIHASQPGTPLEYNSVSSYFMPSFALRVNVN